MLAQNQTQLICAVLRESVEVVVGVFVSYKQGMVLFERLPLSHTGKMSQ